MFLFHINLIRTKNLSNYVYLKFSLLLRVKKLIFLKKSIILCQHFF